jgi:hypothetical protein
MIVFLSIAVYIYGNVHMKLFKAGQYNQGNSIIGNTIYDCILNKYGNVYIYVCI